MQYFGGKQKIAKYISNFINAIHIHTYTHYVEPFCGSCNVASKVNIQNKILNDKNPYLIAMFKELQKGWIPPDVVTEEDYKNAKLNKDNEPHLAGFIGFACSFAGKWWGGYARSNVDRNYALNGKNTILEKMKTLQNAQFICHDFQDLNYNNCIIYCDPPYKNTTQYCKSILGEFPYDNFLKWVKKQSKTNIVLVSEYKHNAPEDAKILLEINSKKDIRDKNGNQLRTTEVLWAYNTEELN